MTLSEIILIMDQIKPEEEFYNDEVNKSIILNKNGNLTFSDGGNPFSLKYKDLKFYRRERQQSNPIKVESKEYDEKVWDDTFNYLNSDKSNLISVSEIEKKIKYSNDLENKKMLEMMYPTLYYSLELSERILYKEAKILQNKLNCNVTIDFKHGLLVSKTGDVYRAYIKDKSIELKEENIVSENIDFDLIGNINSNYRYLKDEIPYDDKKTVYKGIGINNTSSRNYPVFTDEMAKLFMEGAADVVKNPDGQYEIVLKNNNSGKYIIDKNGELRFVSFNLKKFKSHYYNDNLSFEFFSTAEGYFDAALNQCDNYRKRFEKLNMLCDDTKNSISYGYIQSSIIKTLLAFSCECYLKALLLNNGKDIEEIKSLKHNLIDLFNGLSLGDIQNIFENMEKNGYKSLNYKSKYLSYDDPILENKFMDDLAKSSEAFMDVRYCAEDDKNLNYGFLVKFAYSLREISKSKYNQKSVFDDGTYFNK